jgi:hypothetical protein
MGAKLVSGITNTGKKEREKTLCIQFQTESERILFL